MEMWKSAQKVPSLSYKLFHASENFAKKRVNRQLKLCATSYAQAFTAKIFRKPTKHPLLIRILLRIPY